MPRRFRLVWMLPFAVPILFASLVLIQVWDQYRPQPPTPSIQPRDVQTGSAHFRLLALHDICAAGADYDNTVLAIDHQVVYLYSDGTPRGPYIRSQDVFQASPSWQSAGTPYPFSMAAFGDSLFLASSLEVRAYDLRTGDTLWLSRVLPGHAGNAIRADLRHGLTIYYTQDSPLPMSAVVLRLDPETGSLVQKSAYPIPQFALMAPASIDAVLWLSGEDMWLSPTATDLPSWRIRTPGRVAEWPLTFGNLLIVASGLFPQIMAIDMASGQTAWQDQREFVSLPVLHRNMVYALTKNAELVGLDPQTGSERASLQFSPPATEFRRSYLYAVASSNDILAVYFGDSCQLFVFATPAA